MDRPTVSFLGERLSTAYPLQLPGTIDLFLPIPLLNPPLFSASFGCQVADVFAFSFPLFRIPFFIWNPISVMRKKTKNPHKLFKSWALKTVQHCLLERLNLQVPWATTLLLSNNGIQFGSLNLPIIGEAALCYSFWTVGFLTAYIWNLPARLEAESSRIELQLPETYFPRLPCSYDPS